MISKIISIIIIFYYFNYRHTNVHFEIIIFNRPISRHVIDSTTWNSLETVL
jgi:hypothetical protein